MDRSLLIQQAEKVLKENGEEWLRCAIGRAYYYLYHSAILFTNGEVPMRGRNGEKLSGGMHNKLQQYFSCHCADGINGRYSPILLKKLGVFLKIQHKRRCDADYRLSLPINPTVVRTSIREIKIMVSEIEFEIKVRAHENK
ncbi:TPA: hypothetical protein MIG60_10350 [Klebsiella pneumoniae]|uniref:hypothetical protein n=1 Tax=Klebsiella pneumoniae TaxID=573 RepID=UPI0020CC65A4|nr:hypothetical protein [Klebsiella pneumoniae]MCQ0477659.1 hypothetical protein [Klebsiella pneumoniae]MCQ0781614.1 hypothetical protein [Klebsiella pneumoniae]HBM2937540.1 hypothetical protein [Klebsiella michiganensis]HBX7804697.1 hypothetical protein [Klebsiella pneumoniae]